MELPTPNTPRSSFITILAVISIILQLLMIYEGFETLRMAESIRSMPGFAIAQEMMPGLSVSPTEVYGEMSLYLLGIIASVALWLRRDWGRKMYLAVLTGITGWQIATGISSYRMLSAFDGLPGTGGTLPLLVMGTVLGVAVNGVIAVKLLSQEVRKEFH
ncbi:MAG: hypothetical protein HUU02_04280 [Bacteroidetes bacterium]|nr:hypothetical protein [Bacteroidota bacterium]